MFILALKNKSKYIVGKSYKFNSNCTKKLGKPWNAQHNH